MPRRYRDLNGSAEGSVVSRYGHRGVKLVQRGTVTFNGASTSGTAAVTAVDPNNAILSYLGYTNTDGTNINVDNPTDYCCSITLTNSTTVTASRVGNTNLSTHTVSFELVEYWPKLIRSVTYSTVTITAAASGTATVAVSDVNKTSLVYLGYVSNATTASRLGATFPTLVLTNATTVTATLGAGTATITAQFCLVEYF